MDLCVCKADKQLCCFENAKCQDFTITIMIQLFASKKPCNFSTVIPFFHRIHYVKVLNYLTSIQTHSYFKLHQQPQHQRTTRIYLSSILILLQMPLLLFKPHIKLINFRHLLKVSTSVLINLSHFSKL